MNVSDTLRSKFRRFRDWLIHLEPSSKILVGVVLFLLFGAVYNIPAWQSDVRVLNAEPKVIAYFPQDGAVGVALDEHVRVSFSDGVVRETVVEAFALSDVLTGTAVEGAFEWTSPIAVAFVPNEALQKDTAYEVVLGETIKTLDGDPLSNQLQSWRFTTLGDTKVVYSAPTETAARDTLLTVMFDRPMVSLTSSTANQAREALFSIDPPLVGKGSWVGTSAYVFRPEQELDPATKYTVTVAEGFGSTAGNVLPASYTYSFVTERPTVENIYYQTPQFVEPKEDEIAEDVEYTLLYNRDSIVYDVAPQQVWKVEFSFAANEASVQDAFSLIKEGESSSIAVDFSWNSESEVLIRPVTPLEPSQMYRAIFKAGFTAEGSDIGAETNTGWKFQVTALPGFESSTPSSDTEGWGDGEDERGSTVDLNFSSPMNLTSLQDQVVVSPTPETEVTVTGYGKRLYVNFWQSPSTTYTITIPPTVKDAFGRELGAEYTISFGTAALPQTIGIVSTSTLNKYFAYHNADVAPKIITKVTNVSYIDFTMYELTDLQVNELVKEYANFYYSSKTWQDLSYEQYTKVHEWRNMFASDADVPFNVATEITKDGELFKPGIYLLEAEIENGVHDNIILVLSRSSMLAKAHEHGLFTWVTDLDTAEPVAGIDMRAYGLSRLEIGRKSTDSDGVAQLGFDWSDGYEHNYVAIGRSDSDVVMTASVFDEGIDPYEFGIGQVTYDKDESVTLGFVTLDRPIYRPGDTVHFKGYIRDEIDVQFSIPSTGTTIYAEIIPSFYSDTKVTILKEEYALNEFGSFDGSVQIGADVKPGTYYLQIKSSENGPQILSQRLQIEAYRKPEYDIAVGVDKDVNTIGETARIDVSAEYFGGGAVANAEVSYTVAQRGSHFAWTANPSYQFYNPEAAYSTSYINSQSGTGATGPDGVYAFDLPLVQDAEKDNDWNVSTHTVQVDVEDQNGQVVIGENRLQVFNSESPVGIKRRAYFGKIQEPASFDIVTLSQTQDIVPNKLVQYEVYEVTWSFVREQGTDGRFYYTYETNKALHTSGSVLTDANGSGVVTFNPARGGQYLVLVKSTDAKARVWTSGAYFWVSTITQNDLLSVAPEDSNTVELLLDKDHYSVGETANVFAALPFGTSKGLVTVERRGVLDYSIVSFDSNSAAFDISVKDAYAPNVFISLTAVKPGNSVQNYPDVRMGLARMLVHTDRHEIAYSLSTDKEQYEPGETVSYTIEAKDIDGNPVASDVSLAVVDKAVLTLSNIELDQIVKAFYSFRRYGLQPSHSLVASLEKVIMVSGFGTKGGSGAAGDGGGEATDTSRNDFLDTVVFEANIRTDANGRAAGSFVLPDNVTTFNLLAIGADKETRVGTTNKDIFVSRAVYIRPLLPRFGLWDDALTVRAAVHNQTTVTQLFTVTNAVEGLTLIDGEQSRQISVEPGAVGTVSWDGVVNRDISDVDVTFSATTETGLSDSIIITFPVRAALAHEVTATGGHTTTSIEETISLDSDRTTESESTLTLEASASLLSHLKSGLEFCAYYPYKSVPAHATKILSYLLAKQINDTYEQDLFDNLWDVQSIEGSLQYLYNAQRADGGWGYSDTATTSSPYISGLVALTLDELEDADIEVNDESYDLAKEYIERLQQTKYGEDISLETFLVYVDARVNSGNVPRMQVLFDRYLEEPLAFSMASRAYLIKAMDENIRKSARDLQILESSRTRLYNDMVGAARVTANTARWEDVYDYSTQSGTSEVSAHMLQILLRTDAQHPLLDKTMQYLLDLKKHKQWGSNISTITILDALVDYIEVVENGAPNYTYTISLADSTVVEGGFDSTSIYEQNSAILDNLPQYGEGDTSVHLLKAGEGTLYYRLILESYLPLEQSQPIDQGIAVSREYFDENGNSTRTAQPGDVVTARISFVNPEGRNNVIVEDFFPAGLEGINVSLATERSGNGSRFSRTDNNHIWRGWYYWYTNQQFYDERVVLFTDYLEEGMYEFTYRLRATTPGTFAAEPARVYEEFQPDVNGISAHAVFTVTGVN